jgi:cellulose synthase operon protein C
MKLGANPVPFRLSRISLSLTLGLGLLSYGCAQRTAGPSDLLSQAQVAISKGDYASAEIHLKNVLQANPNDAASRAGMAKLNLSLALFGAAEAESRRALELGADAKSTYPVLLESLAMQGDYQKLQESASKMQGLPGIDAATQAIALTSLARAQFGLKNPNEALTSLDQALKIQPDSAAVQAGRLTVQMVLSKDPKALRPDFDALFKSAPESFEVQALAGNIFRIEGNLALAQTAIAKAVALKPYDIEQRAALIRTLVDQKNFAEADLQIQALAKLVPKRPLVAYLAGLSAFGQGNLANARENLQRFVDAMPDFVPGLELAGEVALQSGEFGQAEKYAKALVSKQPGSLSGPRLLASTYLAMNAPEKALTVLAPLLQAKVNAPDILALTGEVLMRTGDTQKGIQYLDAASAAASDSTSLKLAAANARLNTGADATGLQMLEAASAGVGSPQADLAIARSFANAKRYDKAMTLANRFVQAQPKDPIGPYTQGMIAAASGGSDEAAKAFAQALVLNSSYLPAADALAQLDLAKGKLEDAKARYNGVLKANPKHVGAYLALARLSALAGGADVDALAYFKQAREAEPSASIAAVEQARFHLARGQADHAVVLLEPLVQANPKDTTLGATLASAYEASGALGKAITLVEREIQDNPLSGALNYRVGMLRLKLSDYSGAMNSFKRAQELQPSAMEPKVAIASTLFSAGKKAEAFAAAKTIHAEAPTNAVGPSLMGDFLAADGKQAESLGAYRKAFELAKNPSTAYKLYKSLHLNQQADAARTHLRAWWPASKPSDVATMIGASEILLERKDWKEAAAVLNEVLKVNPRSTAALNNAAIAVHNLKEPKALQLAERAFQIEPQNYAIMDTYGWILVEQDRLDDGLKLLKAAAVKAPKSPGVRLHLAQAFAKSGDKKQAQLEAQNALMNNPGADVKAQAERLLN